jgi:hypothetical protein
MAFGVEPLASPVTGQGRLYYYNGASNRGTGIVYYNRWQHVAFVRSGSTMTFYIDGVAGGTATISGTQTGTATTNPIWIGSKDNGLAGYGTAGYISNLRIVNGSPVYTTGNFTPSTTPLPDITNTVLLTCQSNRFLDTNTQVAAKTVTPSGTVSIQAFSPFAPSAAYSPSVNGGSGYFDGSGDYLTIAAGSGAVDYGTGDFNFEAWVYITGAATRQTIIASRFWLEVGPTTMQLTAAGVATLYALTGLSNIQSSWAHIAVSRESGTLRSFRNGVLVSTLTSNTTNFDTTGGTIGIESGSLINPLTGYISNLRSVKGSAVYTAAFTPPTAPLTAITNTSLLTNFTNAGIFDNTGKNNLETVGDAQIDTTVKKYGTGSMEFDGTGDWLRLPASPDLNMSTGAATVECWLYITAAIQDYRMIVSDAANGQNYIALRSLSSIGTQIEITVNNTAFRIELSGAISQNTWHHLAVVRSGNTFTAYVDGASLGTGSSSASWNLGNGGTFIGRWGGATAYEWPGYIDDLRITKGIARYTANFTPPTAAFEDQ